MLRIQLPLALAEGPTEEEVMPQPEGAELDAVRERRAALKEQYLRKRGDRPASPTGGVPHAAFIAKDAEETIRCWQETPGSPGVEVVGTRGSPGSSHFFFDIG